VSTIFRIIQARNMYPFSVKFKIEVEKASSNLTANNLLDYFESILTTEKVEISSKSTEQIKFTNDWKIRLFNVISMIDSGFIRVENTDEKTLRIIYGIKFIRQLFLTIPAFLIIAIWIRQFYPVWIGLVLYLLSTLTLIARQYNFFSNSVDRYLESEN